MNNTDKTIEALKYNINSINRHLELVITNIKEHAKYLDDGNLTSYHLIIQWCNTVITETSKRDGLLFALEGLKEEDE